MQHFQLVPNIAVDGDEFTSGFLGLDWLPSAQASADKRNYETGVLTILTGLIRTWTGWAVMTDIFGNPGYRYRNGQRHGDKVFAEHLYGSRRSGGSGREAR